MHNVAALVPGPYRQMAPVYNLRTIDSYLEQQCFVYYGDPTFRSIVVIVNTSETN